MASVSLTATQARASAAAAERRYNMACQSYRDAQRAFTRSRSATNRQRLAYAAEDLDTATAAFRAADDLASTLHGREMRAARVAMRSASAPQQLAFAL